MLEGDADQNTQKHFCSYKNDPETLLKLLNTFVKVRVIKDCSYLGFIHSIDPVSHSIILSVPNEETYETILIPGHAVSDVTSVEPPSNIKPPQRKQSKIDSIEDINIRRKKLISWFKKNLLPVTELEDRIVLGNATVLHPYSISDIGTENSIVAMQIRSIMESMPDDFVPKNV